MIKIHIHLLLDIVMYSPNIFGQKSIQNDFKSRALAIYMKCTIGIGTCKISRLELASGIGV